MLREFIPEPAYSTTDEDTVFALLSRRAERDPEDLIAQWQDDETRRWHDVTAGEMLERVRAVAKGLLGLGVKTGNMVVIYSPTCYEWGVVDFACAAIGAVSVPVYETDSAKQAESIVEEVNPVIAFAGDSAHTQTLEQIREGHSSLRYVFNFKADGLDAVADFGEGVSEDALDQVIARVKADDMLTIVYTSQRCHAVSPELHAYRVERLHHSRRNAVSAESSDAVPAVGTLFRPLHPICCDWRARSGRLSSGSQASARRFA